MLLIANCPLRSNHHSKKPNPNWWFRGTIISNRNTDMPGIFICYRRDDASPYAGRLYDHISARFGSQRVFMDIDTIRPGDDFVQVISGRVAACDALIAVIGKNWLSCVNSQLPRSQLPRSRCLGVGIWKSMLLKRNERHRVVGVHRDHQLVRAGVVAHRRRVRNVLRDGARLPGPDGCATRHQV